MSESLRDDELFSEGDGAFLAYFAAKLQGLIMADTSFPSPNVVYPEWQNEFRAALLELDIEKLRERVAAAETAIFNRLQAISQGSNHAAERQAIEDALASLRVLKRDNLGFPDWEKK